MKKTTTKKQDAANQLMDKCCIYLNDNFHRFSQANKIKIALELVKKKLPEKTDNSIHLTPEQRKELADDIRKLR